MKIKFKQYSLMFIMILAVILTISTVTAQSISNETLITTDSSQSSNINNEIIDESIDYTSVDSQIITQESSNTNDTTETSTSKTLKTATKYSTIYVNSQGLSSNTGENDTSPTTFSNALNTIADGGVIYLTSSTDSDIYNLTSRISISSSSSLKSLSIIAQDGKNITISGNHKSNLFYIYGMTLNFTNINFVDANTTANSALYLSRSTVNLYNCSFSNNNASYGGVIYQSYSTLNINSSYFANNTAFSGGCIYSSNSNTNITNTRFESNNASFGAAVFNYKSDMNVSNSTFEDNCAEGYGGAIIHLNPTTLNIDNSQFISNKAEYGAAVYVMYADVNISKTIFKSNNANLASSIYSYNNTLKLKYSLLNDEDNNLYLNNLNYYDIDENWWALNNPDFNRLTSGIIPDNWVLMTFANTTSTTDSTYNIQVSLNTLSDSTNMTDLLPQTTVTFTSESGIFNFTDANITGQLTNTYTGSDAIYATIDNQTMNLNSKIIPLLYADNITAKKSSTVNITINQNNDITGTVKLTLNNNTRTLNAQNEITTTLTIDENQTGTIPVYLEYTGDDKYDAVNYTVYITITPSTYLINDTITRLYSHNNTNQSLPSSYSLVDEGQVTSVKAQGSSGSCVSFAAIGALETSILKATNQSLDLSENNLKNMFKLYSVLGLQYLEPNNGGYDPEPIGYFVSGLGPVYESQDEYGTSSHISRIYNTSIQIQNINIIPHRQNYTDNDLIKEAIMKYGAVFTGIKSSSNTNIYNYDVYDATHAICIVGWDDNYSKENFSPNAPGDGAFIIKNSWGTSTGINGYNYVSYYDEIIGYLSSQSSTDLNFAIDYHNNYNYTNIYQYDTVCYIYEIEDEGGQYWIKNKYTVDKNETIAAIGSYFMDTSGYTMQLYINDNLVTELNSTVDYPGYRTIELDNLYRVNENDEITVVLNIKQSIDSSILYVPLQDSDYNIEYMSGVSYLSFDGTNYDDLYSYGGSGKFSAPIKIYMQDIPEITSNYTISSNNILINTTTNKKLTNATVYYRINGEDIIDDEDNLITYKIEDSDTVVASIDISLLNEGNYTYDITVENEGYNITKTFNFTIISIRIEAENTTGVINDILNATVRIYDNNNNLITDGNVIFTDNKNTLLEQTTITNGICILNTTFTNTYNDTIKVYYYNEYYDNNTLYDTFTLNIRKADTRITIEYDELTAGETVNITAYITDENNNTVNGGKVIFKINGKTLKDSNGKVIYITVTDSIATIEYTIPESYANKNITITVVYSGSSKYNSQRNNTTVIIQEKQAENLSFTQESYTSKVNETIQITVNVNNQTTGKVVFKINGKTVKDENGKVIYLSVSNNQATLNYTIPTTYKTKTYTLTAVYITSNQKIETQTTLTITK